MESIRGRVALVTGASQGLGKVIAERLAAEGCHVVVNAARHLDKAKGVADAIRATGFQATRRGDVFPG